jgi:FkbM family methyltransferase
VSYTFGPEVQFDPADLDRMFQECFGYKTDGTFVEVGAYDGKTYSHTWGLAELGWTGVYVEPVPALAARCTENHANHPDIVTIQAAIGETWGVEDLFIDEFSCCGSTLNPEVCKTPKKIKVPVMPLDSLLAKTMILPGFDLLSIDVEFGEVGVLKGFTLGRWLPKMIIIELCEKHDEPKHSMAQAARDMCADLMPQHQYRQIYADWINTIFVRP